MCALARGNKQQAHTEQHQVREIRVWHSETVNLGIVKWPQKGLEVC